MTAIAQPSFTTGELAPSLHGRVDLARFYTALRTCRNFIVRPYGGVMNRAGTEFCGEVKDSTKKTRLIEFVYSSDQAFVLEVGEEYIRFYYNGGLVLNGETPVEVETPYLEEVLFYLKYVQSGDVITFCHNEHKTKQLSRFSNTNWTLTDFSNREGPFLDINVDTGKTIIASATEGAILLTANVDIFTTAHIGLMLYLEQSPNDNVQRWEPGKERLINDIRRRGASYYRAVTSGTCGTVAPSVVEGTECDGDPGVKWEYLHSGYGIVEILAVADAQHASGIVTRRLPDSLATVSGVIKNVTDVVTGVEGVPPTETTPEIFPISAKVQVMSHGFPSGSLVTIEGVLGATEVNGEWTITLIDSNWFYLNGLILTSGYTGGGTAKLSNDAVPAYKWAFEAWGGAQGFPGTTIYYQQRQVFGGTLGENHKLWMSKTAGYNDFGQSNPLLDDDAISCKVQSDKSNEIRHFIRMKDLIALTSEAAWIIRKDQGNMVPVTDEQEASGASHIKPLKIGKKGVFVEDGGAVVRSIGFEYSSDSYEGQDLTLTGNHLLFGRQIVDWAYQKRPYRCIWIVLDDGQLLGLTYMPDQEVIGWHRHDTDGLFESVCCIPEGNEDSVYVAVKRGNNRFVERFKSRMFTDIKDAFFVDCGLTYDGRTVGAGITFTLTGGTEWTYEETLTFTTGTAFFSGVSDVGDQIVLNDGEDLRLTILEYTSATEVQVLASRTVPVGLRSGTGFQVARNTFSGLNHLEGNSVSILADGNVYPPQIVTGGAIALESPAVVVHAGLPIVADFETLDLNVQGQSIQDKVKNIRSVTLLVEKTRGLKVGPDPDNLLELSPMMSGFYDQPIKEETGILKANIRSDWSETGRVFVRQDQPLPATILAAIPDAIIGGA